jgi:hypothetical protein
MFSYRLDRSFDGYAGVCPRCGADEVLVCATQGGYCLACTRAFVLMDPFVSDTPMSPDTARLERCYRLPAATRPL